MLPASVPPYLPVAAQLAAAVRAGAPHTERTDLVLGFRNESVPLAHALAQHLGAPLDLLAVLPLTLRGLDGYVVGAMASIEGQLLEVYDVPYVRRARRATFDVVGNGREAREELVRRRSLRRGLRGTLHVRQQHVVLTDIGDAPLPLWLAALQALGVGGAARITLAAPTLPADVQAHARQAGHRVVMGEPTLESSRSLRWTGDVPHDREVLCLLAAADAGDARAGPIAPH